MWEIIKAVAIGLWENPIIVSVTIFFVGLNTLYAWLRSKAK